MIAQRQSHLPGRPRRFSAEELTPIGAPAFQGEHNFEVFGEFGIPESELTRLADAGVLVTHPRARDVQAAVKPPIPTGQVA